MRALISILILSILGLGQAFAESLELSWQHPTEREDGSALPLDQVQGYEIDWGLCTGTQSTVMVGQVESHSVPLPDPGYGEWCASIRTVDTDGNRSATVGPVIRKIIAPPKPPTLFTVESVAYDVRIHPQQGLVAHRVVGWVPIGAECYTDPYGQPFLGGDLYGVDPAFVAFSKDPQSELIVARCAPAGG